jgi:hypothetical protein
MTASAAWLAALLLSTAGFVGQAGSHAAPDRHAPATLESTVPPSDGPVDNSAALELAVLRARLEEEQGHNGEVLQTVYWSLGVIATLTLLLVGYSWFTNFRVYERDKEMLAEALRMELRAGLAEAQRSTREAMSEIREKAADLASAIRSESDAAIEAGMKAHASRIEGHLRALEARLLETQLSFELLNADVLFERHLHGNGIRSYLSAASIAKRLGRADCVERILGDLEKRLKQMNGVFGTDITEISRFLDEFDGVTPVQKARLTEVLRTVRRL